MNNSLSRHLLGPVMFWTVLTTLFAWLPLVRIIGRPDGYHWKILGISGEGLQGPFWIFIPFAVFAIVLLYTGERGPRTLFYPLLILWNLFVLAIVIAVLVQGEAEALWQGQGLYWKIPMWIVAVPAAVFAVLAIAWVAMDRRNTANGKVPWARKNTVRVVGSIVLLSIALVLFRAGTNYNSVTALAIVTAILHWLTLSWSFAPIKPDTA